jgi:diaminopimelate epimerase
VFEQHELFPEKTNVHFSQIINRDNINVLVWERGAGATLACGTGACAVHVAAYKLGLCNSKTVINLPGGNLIINWSRSEDEILMTGNAKKVFSGTYILK